ncbi:FMN-binding negative transcriptional regulator [Telluribacter sp.]|jgi:transcriptional regulator|uniref:FMN-binding negative transcriptional regulator n=1 Tax=Telluribacter sp. TaxID=1978767 RepID=UPI002E0D4872|nr:FMN-binding negative transcriptional regulator [Telluribacter sp.]
MYIPKIFAATDQQEILSFMQEHSFATLITATDNVPTATHLPFVISVRDDKVVLTSHFARANEQWKEIADNQVLVIFAEPHAYISPGHYDKEQNVPTWNYFSVHAYGQGQVLPDSDRAFEVLEATINTYEKEYKSQWDSLPDDYKQKMVRGIVAFEIVVTDLQAKKKLSQNRTEVEQRRIKEVLSESTRTHEREVADYMKLN